MARARRAATTCGVDRTLASRAITPPFIGKQGIDVDLADLGMMGDEIAEADQSFGDGLDISGRAIAIALQQVPHAWSAS